jgi:hypothetical protein
LQTIHNPLSNIAGNNSQIASLCSIGNFNACTPGSKPRQGN